MAHRFDGDSSSRVLIVGAGPGGLAAAIALGRIGLRPTVVERVDHVEHARRGSTALWLPGNGAAAARELGVLDALLATGAVLHEQLFCDPSGKRLARVDFDAMWRDVGPCVSVGRTELHDILRAAPGIEIRHGDAVRTVTPGRPARVTFADGRSEAWDLVIGSDGVHSVVRETAFPGWRAETDTNRYCRLLFPRPDGLDAWTALLSSRAQAVLIPVDAKRAYASLNLLGVATGTEPTAADLRAAFRGFHLDVAAALEHLGDAPHITPGRTVPVGDPVRDGVVLLGDAAHAMPPSMAEGASLAFEDAVVLAEEIERHGLAGGPRAYADRRRARIAWVQQRTRRRDRAARLPDLLRRVLFGLAGAKIATVDYVPLVEQRP